MHLLTSKMEMPWMHLGRRFGVEIRLEPLMLNVEDGWVDVMMVAGWNLCHAYINLQHCEKRSSGFDTGF